MEKTLTSIYLDPSQPASFGGLDAVYRAVKKKGKNKISRKEVRERLSQLDVYTLHKPARRLYKGSRVIVPRIDAQFQADLVGLQNLSRYNKGYKYLPTCRYLQQVRFCVTFEDKTRSRTGQSLSRVPFYWSQTCHCKQIKEQSS